MMAPILYVIICCPLSHVTTVRLTPTVQMPKLPKSNLKWRGHTLVREQGCARWARKEWGLWGNLQRRFHLSSWFRFFSYSETQNVAGAWNGTPWGESSTSQLIFEYCCHGIDQYKRVFVFFTLVECFLACWTNQQPSLLLCSAECLPLGMPLGCHPLTVNRETVRFSLRAI